MGVPIKCAMAGLDLKRSVAIPRTIGANRIYLGIGPTGEWTILVLLHTTYSQR